MGSGGRLRVPVNAGLRQGVVSARLWTEPTRDGVCLVVEVEDEVYRLHRPAVGIVSLGAVGALATTLWPFYPPLLGFAPIAAVLALSAWFLVNSRLRSASLHEFLDLVVDDGVPTTETSEPV